MLNGVFQVLCSQFLLFTGIWFSAATLGDCALVQVSEPVVVREDGATASHLGFASYRDETNGLCYYWTTSIPSNYPNGQPIYGYDQIRYYLEEVLGSNWYTGHACCGAAFVLSLLAFLYSISYCCSTQVRGVRSFAGLYIGVILTLLQALGTYQIYRSSWCGNDEDEEDDGYGCTMSRSTIFSIIASGCFFLSGFFFLIMTDYPGRKKLREIEAIAERVRATEAEKERNDAAVAAGGAGAATAFDQVPTTILEDEPPEEEALPGDDEYEYYDEEEGGGGSSSSNGAAVGDKELDDNIPQESAPEPEQQVDEELPDSSTSIRSLASDASEIPRPPSR